ncbi:MAG: ATP-binding protein [Candidatus Odinarchaeota archaeon]
MSKLSFSKHSIVQSYSTKHSQLIIVVTSYILYLVVHAILCPHVGYIAGSLLSLVIIACAWFFGTRIGLSFGFISVPLSDFIFTFFLSRPDYFYNVSNPAFFVLILITGLIGCVTGYLSTVTKKLRKEIMKREDFEKQLIHQRNELSDLAHMMQHDLRNSLQVIQGYSTLLMEKHDDTMFQEIINHVELIDKLLAKSVKLAEAGLVVDIFNEVNLDAVLWKAVESTVQPYDIDFSADRLPVVRGDEDKIFQVFKNLLENAVKHGKPEKIEVKATKTPEGHVIRVINDGNPILLAKRSELFQELSKKNKAGGLGLKIIKRIIDAHGWDICLEGGLDRTVFKITIYME